MNDGDGLTLGEYRALVESLPTMIWRAAPDKKCNYFNDAWLTFTGRTLEQELGDGWAEGVHPEDLALCLETYVTHFDRREPFEMEYRLRRHDGTYRHVLDRGVPFEKDGTFAGYVGSCVDVEERRQAEAARNTLLSMMAHELRTPLQTLMNYVELFRLRSASGEVIERSLLDRFGSQIKQFGTLVDTLSDISRQERGLPIELDVEPFDLSELVEELVASRESSEAPHRFERSIERGAGVRGDRRRLGQAIGNLLDNAIKYSPEGGDISVALGRDAEGWRMTIRDRGIGIPREEVAQLGKRYFRGSNASHRNYPGLGLGVAFSKDVVSRHGGELAFESDVDRGTRATLWLPTSPPEEG